MNGSSPRVAIVTGGGGGIGLGIAASLSEAGHDVAIWDVREAAAQEAAEALAAKGRRSIGVACDVSKQDQVQAATAAVVDQLGVPYLLVNNAGVSRIGRLEDAELADWQAVLDVNLTGVFLCTQAVGREMLAAGNGCIVNVASVSGRVPQVFRPAYSVTKAGVILLTQLTALEWGPRGVRCNSISPGMVWTGLGGAVYDVPQLLQERQCQIPLKRLAEPAEMGSVVVFLASDAAAYVNGVDLPVDGGLLLTMLNRLPTIGPDGTVVHPELLPS